MGDFPYSVPTPNVVKSTRAEILALLNIKYQTEDDVEELSLRGGAL